MGDRNRIEARLLQRIQGRLDMNQRNKRSKPRGSKDRALSQARVDTYLVVLDDIKRVSAEFDEEEHNAFMNEIMAEISTSIVQEEESSHVVVEPHHPIWRSFDDDDWNGATASMWLNSLAGKTVTLNPPRGLPTELYIRIEAAVREATKPGV